MKISKIKVFLKDLMNMICMNISFSYISKKKKFPTNGVWGKKYDYIRISEMKNKRIGRRMTIYYVFLAEGFLLVFSYGLRNVLPRQIISLAKLNHQGDGFLY